MGEKRRKVGGMEGRKEKGREGEGEERSEGKERGGVGGSSFFALGRKKKNRRLCLQGNTVSGKGNPPTFLVSLCQMLADFQSSFTRRFSPQFQ